ncbi:MAG: aldehyde-activating protein [Thalassolituus sp. CG17_big_fil_post_rev_8_21_14_2_50_53_8]|nr:MAG: aldehyde-activating protein [Thalassolituus sp. CG17_big_fil_post_rev_8_21_14_2_50_53_8]
MTTSYKGSCLCGAVQFTVTGDFQSFFLCHCQHCQKDTGSAHAANLFSTSATLNWDRGAEQVKVFNLPNSCHCKSFCRECGSALPTQQMDSQLLVVPAGSLDNSLSMRPNAHLFMASKADWDHDLEHVAKLDGLPG